jgi:hypothetical protein
VTESAATIISAIYVKMPHIMPDFCMHHGRHFPEGVTSSLGVVLCFLRELPRPGSRRFYETRPGFFFLFSINYFQPTQGGF